MSKRLTAIIPAEPPGTMKRPWVLAMKSASISLAAMSGFCFAAGIIMGLIDRLGAEEKSSLWQYGFAGALFGTILFGLPVAIATGVHR